MKAHMSQWNTFSTSLHSYSESPLFTDTNIDTDTDIDMEHLKLI